MFISGPCRFIAPFPEIHTVHKRHMILVKSIYFVYTGLASMANILPIVSLIWSAIIVVSWSAQFGAVSPRGIIATYGALRQYERFEVTHY